MTIALIIATVFFAALLQSLSGFGFALLIMPVISLALGLQTAGPTVALIGLTVYSVNLLRLHRAIDLAEVARMVLGSALGLPVGLWLFANGSESVVKRILGLFLIAYALFSLLRPEIHWVPSRVWVYPAGFLAGCLGGAYNTAGPPVILYGSMRQWPRDEFRSSLQAFFFVNAILVVASHVIAHRLTPLVLTSYVAAIPALAGGILVGTRLDKHVRHQHFRTLVMVMILFLGLTLVFGAG